MVPLIPYTVVAAAIAVVITVCSITSKINTRDLSLLTPRNVLSTLTIVILMPLIWGNFVLILYHPAVIGIIITINDMFDIINSP